VKKYIREIMNDLRGRNRNARIPAVRKPLGGEQTADVDRSPQGVVPEDLNNQVLSSDPVQRAKQLDFQAQKSEERQRS
jgi:hypothetical protein